MDIENILQKFDEMLAQGQMQAAVDYLENKAAQCGEEGYSTLAITIFNELEGFWRVAGQKEKSYAAAETALGLISSCRLDGTIGHATTLLNYATAKTAFGEAGEALGLYDRVKEIYDALNLKETSEKLIEEYYHAALKSLESVSVTSIRKKQITTLAKNLMFRES